MDSVVHFEMPYDDRDRMAKFYSEAFGWENEKLGEDMGNYVVAITSETDENRMVKEPGRINGGFFARSADMPAQYPSVVVSVENIEEAMQKVRNAWGKVLGEPMDIPNVGQYVSFVDTEGNRASILQPRMRD